MSGFAGIVPDNKCPWRHDSYRYRVRPRWQPLSRGLPPPRQVQPRAPKPERRARSCRKRRNAISSAPPSCRALGCSNTNKPTGTRGPVCSKCVAVPNAPQAAITKAGGSRGDKRYARTSSLSCRGGCRWEIDRCVAAVTLMPLSHSSLGWHAVASGGGDEAEGGGTAPGVESKIGEHSRSSA